MRFLSHISGHFRWVLISSLLIIISFIIEHTHRTEADISTADLTKISEYLKVKSKEGHALIALIEAGNPSVFDSIRRNHPHKQWEALVLENDIPVWWTSAEFGPDTGLFNLNPPGLFETRNKTFWVHNSESGNRKVFVAFPLQYYELGETHYLFPLPGGFEIELGNNLPQSIPIPGFEGISLRVMEQQQGSLPALILLAFAFFILGAVSLFRKLNRVQVIYTILLWSVLRWLLYARLLGVWLSNLEIMDPKIYASSFLLPSLGDLILHVVFSAFLLNLLSVLSFKKVPEIWRSLIATILTFFITDLCLSLLKGLVLDSSISFNPATIVSLNGYSILASLTACILVYLWMRWIEVFGNINFNKSNIFMVLLGGLSFALFQIIDGNRTLQSLWVPVIVSALGLYVAHYKRELGNTANFLWSLFLSSVLAASAIYFFNRIHEKEYLNFYANKLVTEKDIEAEYEFMRMENKLVAEFLVPEDFNNYMVRREQFEKRLRRLFFTGYLDKYEIRVYSFDSLGHSLSGKSDYTFGYLNDLYNLNAMPTMSNHFYHIKDPTVINGYIARFDNCDLEGHNGSAFLVLQPKFIQVPHLFPRLLKKGKPSSGIDISGYSYGIYVNGRLMHQKGDFAYPLAFLSGTFRPGKIGFLSRRYVHFVNLHSTLITVVLSRPENILSEAFSLFTLLFILLFIATSLWILLLRAGYTAFKIEALVSSDVLHKLARESSPFAFSLLSVRIRLALIGLLTAGLLVSVWLTTRYVQNNYNERIRESLHNRLLDAANQLQNENSLAFKLKNADSRQLLINQLSDQNRQVFHLYSSNGELLASSEPQLFEQKIIGRLMHPIAYEQLHRSRVSKFQQNESLAGLNYQAAYVPLLDERRALLAYLNLPYLSEEEELGREVSDFLLAYINLYFLLLLMALGLAWYISKRITRPLTMVRNKISQMVLGGKNEMIEYAQQDEIGQLVKQYNRMIMELEESAMKLSESEREMAWREMARQVAHEIKNPLTPMKLNIQHLQRAWDDKSDKLETTFQKVTRILIEQIDSLSNLASSFSDFARLPKEQISVFDLREIVQDTVHLFEKSSSVHFKIFVPSFAVLVEADREQLIRVFNNLIKNSIQAIEDENQGLIEVKMEVDQGKVRTYILDNGSGIPETLKDKIFVPNFSTKNSGMGLGLAICRKIIESSGGTIKFRSSQNQTEFVVELNIKA